MTSTGGGLNQLPHFRITTARPRQMSAKPKKRRKSGANGHFFAKTGIPFALPSLPQPAYPDASGMPVCAGTGGSITFFDSAETT